MVHVVEAGVLYAVAFKQSAAFDPAATNKPPNNKKAATKHFTKTSAKK
jgi:hypothetical protein